MDIFFWLIITLLAGILYFNYVRKNYLHEEESRGEPAQVPAPGGKKPSWLSLLLQLPAPIQDPKEPGNPGWRAEFLEWLVIIIPIWLYCQPFLATGVHADLPGTESEFFQSFDQILEFSLKLRQFPLWNPYYATGMPYIAHPMLHAFNPFVSLPVLLFGFLGGFKIAICLAFIIAGLGMWWLGRQVGLSPVLRTWVSLMYAFSGLAVAKFLQGQYLMVLAFGWLPFSLAALMAATRNHGKRHIAVAALSLAMLFLSGNFYYAYYMLYVIVIFALVMLFRRDALTGEIKVDWAAFKVLAAIGVLALGLISIQLMPALEYRGQYTKDLNLQLSDSQSFQDVFLDFVTPEPFRPGAYSNSFRPEEYYAYLGWWPLVGMLFLPLAWKKQNRRLIVLFLALIAFVFIWIDVKDMPWHDVFQTVPLFYQFRYPSRMVVVGGMAILMAGGLGLDRLWRLGRGYIWDPKLGEIRRELVIVGTGVLAIFLLWSIADVWGTTQQYLEPWTYDEPRSSIIAWIKNYDPGTYYIDAPNGWDQAVIGNQMRFLNGPPAITLLPGEQDRVGKRSIEAGPKYLVQSRNDPAWSNSVLVKSFPTVDVYRINSTLPFAFSVDDATFGGPDNSPLGLGDVTAQDFSSPDINSLQGTVDGQAAQTLVVFSIFSPNWQLSVDGQAAEVLNADGYLGAQILPGRHQYTFEYSPVSFYRGLAISIFALGLALWLLIGRPQEPS